MLKTINILSKVDLEKYNFLTTKNQIDNMFGVFSDEAQKQREELKKFWRDLGYRYNFQVRKCTIINTGEIYDSIEYENSPRFIEDHDFS